MSEEQDALEREAEAYDSWRWEIHVRDKHIETLQAQVAQMTGALRLAGVMAEISRTCRFDGDCALDCQYYDRETGTATCHGILGEAEKTIDTALQSTGEDYHNPADVQRIAELEKAVTRLSRSCDTCARRLAVGGHCLDEDAKENWTE